MMNKPDGSIWIQFCWKKTGRGHHWYIPQSVITWYASVGAHYPPLSWIIDIILKPSLFNEPEPVSVSDEMHCNMMKLPSHTTEIWNLCQLLVLPSKVVILHIRDSRHKTPGLEMFQEPNELCCKSIRIWLKINCISYLQHNRKQSRVFKPSHRGNKGPMLAFCHSRHYWN